MQEVERGQDMFKTLRSKKNWKIMYMLYTFGKCLLSINIMQILSEHFSKKELWFLTALDLIKCLEQIKLQSLLLICAPISQLQFNISTMVYIVIAS